MSDLEAELEAELKKSYFSSFSSSSGEEEDVLVHLRRPFPSALTDLPNCLLLTILSRCSASSLSALAQTCRTFRHLCTDGMLWRGLCFLRWSQAGFQGTMYQGGWHERYRDQDHRELRAIETSDDLTPEEKQGFLAAEKTRREEIPDAVLHISQVGDKVSMEEEIYRWRLKRGLLKPPRPKGGSKNEGRHVCSKTCRFDCLGQQVFICKATGQVHLCGPQCTEKTNHEDDGVAICELTGLVFEIEEREEEEGGGGGGEGGGGANPDPGLDVDGGDGWNLGRFWIQGYTL